MITVQGGFYKGEVLIRSTSSEPLTQAKLAKNIWIGGVQAVKTLSTSNINNYLYTEEGSPTYTEYGGGSAIWFGSDLDIIYMKSGIGCRSVNGTVQGIDTQYDGGTTTETTVFVVNFIGKTNITIAQTKRSHGYYETEFKTRISCGNNYNEWSGSSASFNFSIVYNGTAYVAKCGSWTVTSEACREQVSRLELAGSKKVISGPYAGFVALKGIVTEGMSRY